MPTNIFKDVQCVKESVGNGYSTKDPVGVLYGHCEISRSSVDSFTATGVSVPGGQWCPAAAAECATFQIVTHI